MVVVGPYTGRFVEEGIALVVEHCRAAAGVAGIAGVAVEEGNRTVHYRYTSVEAVLEEAEEGVEMQKPSADAGLSCHLYKYWWKSSASQGSLS